jgi:DNA-binding transcriptional ArsR family regulator
MVQRSPNGTNGGQTVRLDDWVAAKHPRLHPTRRKVLKTVASLCANGEWATSSDVREHTDLSQQLLNRHLRGLEAEGLIRIEKPGPGLPLNVLPTPLGLRLLGQYESPRARPSEDQAAPEPRPEPEATPSGLGALASRLYQRLEGHLLDLDQRQTEELLRSTLGELAAPAKAEPAVLPEDDLDFGLEPKAEPQAEEAFELEPASEPQPPQLSPAEATLEEKLLLTARAEYRNIIWWQRTRDLSEIWDRTRRRQLGLLNTYFTSFRPRWEYPEWEDFNLARRQADARGADYGDWVKAQFDLAEQQGRLDVAPRELHGEKAIKAYLESRPAQAQPQVDLSQPPYTVDSFDLNDPTHVAYAEALLDQMNQLSQRVYGDDPVGVVNLLVEAVWRGNLPLEALKLRPEYRTAVLAVLQREHPEFLTVTGRQAQPRGQYQSSQYSAGEVPVQTSLKPPLII